MPVAFVRRSGRTSLDETRGGASSGDDAALRRACEWRGVATRRSFSLGASEASERFFPADWTRRRRITFSPSLGSWKCLSEERRFAFSYASTSVRTEPTPAVTLASLASRSARHSIPPPRPMTRRDPRSRQSASSSSSSSSSNSRPRRRLPYYRALVVALLLASFSSTCAEATARQTSRPAPTVVEVASPTNASPLPDASPPPDGRLLGWWWLVKWMPRVVYVVPNPHPKPGPYPPVVPPLVEPNCPEVTTTNGALVRDCCCRSGCAISGTQGPACAGPGDTTRCQPGQRPCNPWCDAFAGGCTPVPTPFSSGYPFYGYGAYQYADVSRRAGTTAERRD